MFGYRCSIYIYIYILPQTSSIGRRIVGQTVELSQGSWATAGRSSRQWFAYSRRRSAGGIVVIEVVIVVIVVGRRNSRLGRRNGIVAGGLVGVGRVELVGSVVGIVVGHVVVVVVGCTVVVSGSGTHSNTAGWGSVLAGHLPDYGMKRRNKYLQYWIAIPNPQFIFLSLYRSN